MGAARDLVAHLSARVRRRVPGRNAARADEHRLRRVIEWLDHAVELGASGIALGPVFASRTHGYDTTDHYRIDPRLGDDGDFDDLVAAGAQAGSAGPARRRLQPRRDRFRDATAPPTRRRCEAPAVVPSAQPGRFRTFEGHGELITLNHDNPEVVDYVADVMAHWLDRGADGWRLDAAYAVPERFWAQVLPRVRERAP